MLNEFKPDLVGTPCTVHMDVDVRNGWLEPGDEAVRDELMSAASDVLCKLLRFCWHDTRGRLRSSKSATVRFTALAAAVNPGFFGKDSLSVIGKRLGVTRSMMSRAVVEFTDTCNLKFRRTKSKATRKHYSEAQKAAWAKRRLSGG